jgi:hypothetical protein
VLGYPITKQTLDNKAAQLVVSLRNTLTAIEALNAWLGAQSDETLLGLRDAANAGYTTAEVSTLRNAYAALKILSDIAHARTANASPFNYLFNADLLVGLELS